MQSILQKQIRISFFKRKTLNYDTPVEDLLKIFLLTDEKNLQPTENDLLEALHQCGFYSKTIKNETYVNVSEKSPVIRIYRYLMRQMS